MSAALPVGRTVPKPLLAVDDVLAAATRIRPYVDETPTTYSPFRRCWLKLESLQVTGAYKVRGALNALIKQVERGDRRAVVAASAGNHGAAVAWAANRLGLEALIAVPTNAPTTKTDRIERLGATVVHHGAHFGESLEWALEASHKRHARFLHAFDDLDVMAGQGTVALELIHKRPDVVVLPIGGGGLASGCSTVLKAAGIRVFGVQVEGVDAMRSILNGGPSSIVPADTLADGLRVSEAGHFSRQICAENLEDVVTVSESHMRHTMASLALHEGIVVEGAGAVAVAALDQVPGSRRIALVSGGNVDSRVMIDVLAEYQSRMKVAS